MGRRSVHVTKLLFNEIQVILQVLDSINYISKTKNKDQSGLENRPENRHDPAQAPEKPNGSSPDSQAMDRPPNPIIFTPSQLATKLSTQKKNHSKTITASAAIFATDKGKNKLAASFYFVSPKE